MIPNVVKQQDYVQSSLLGLFESPQMSVSQSLSYESFISKKLDILEIERLHKYKLDDYILDVTTLGLFDTWKIICSYILQYAGSGVQNDFLQTPQIGELYEIGLALIDKQQKKDSGQYYTPEDVALVMSKWFLDLEAENVCDVACGTGKLILTYLDLIGVEKSKQLLAEGKLYLYDNDKTALYICKTIILARYGMEFMDLIHDCCCDFLDADVSLPKNCKVISNPPYANIIVLKPYWKPTRVLLDTKEFYAAFMEKIITQSEKSVIITPYSFIGGAKFYSLRAKMSSHNGFVVCFDNVPGNIFCGRKHGIFNTNTSNSVRAAITVVKNPNIENGFRISPLIRFKSEERQKLLQCKVLETFIGTELQVVNKANPMFFKCDSRLEEIYTMWKNVATEKLCQLTDSHGTLSVSMANTCRYFTAASDTVMNRGGQITLKFSDKNAFNFVYCLINSSFVYWHWRIYDGGITYPKTLLLNMPTFYELLSVDDKCFFAEVAEEMISKSKYFIVTKNNIGVQENIKFPRFYRDKINRRILDILRVSEDERIMDIVHSNMALTISV